MKLRGADARAFSSAESFPYSVIVIANESSVGNVMSATENPPLGAPTSKVGAVRKRGQNMRLVPHISLPYRVL